MSEQFIVINYRVECLPGFLYQADVEGKRARQQRDRERECVRGRVLRREGDGNRHKMDRWRKTCGANVRLISEMIKKVANYIVSMICIFSLLIYKQHLDLMTSCKSPVIS
jgi:hypothetical protein